jgi:hypothetical protein
MLLNVEISIRCHRSTVGTSSQLRGKFRGPTCCASRDIGICCQPLSVIFTITFELSRERFRTIILYDWKIGFNYSGSHARLAAAWRKQAPSD